MALKGDLDSLDLGQVFQMLAINHKDGVLGVFGTGRPKALRFSSEGVTLQFDPAQYESRILERMRRQGRLSADQMRLVEANRRSSGRSTLDVLIEMDFIDQDEVDEEFRSFMEEDVYELFFLKSSRFEFFEGRLMLEEAGGILDDRYFFNPGSVVMEAARRMDEWEMIRERIPDKGEVYVKTNREADPELLESSAVRTVLALCDGWRSLDQILEASGRSEFEMVKAFMNMVDAGMLSPLDPRQYAATGVSALAEGRCAEAANLFERAGERGFGLPEVLGAAGRAREENADFALAAERYREYAVALRDESRLPEAARALLDAAELIPTDLAARMELVRIGLQAPEVARSAGYDAQALGRSLHKNLTDASDYDAARELLGWMIDSNPDDMELRRALITCVTASGDQKALVELYEQTADHLLQRKEPSKAIPYLQKILMIDRTRADVKERIKELYKADERRRHRRNGTVTLLLCIAFLIVLGGLYAFYERSASEALGTIDVDSLIDKAEFESAHSALETFRERYPLSLSAFEANESMTRIEAAKRNHEANLEFERQQVQRLRTEQAKEAARLWEEARTISARGDLTTALAGLQNALESAPEGWSKVKELREEIAAVENYLREAEDLHEQALEQEEKGEYRSARELYRVLTRRYSETPHARATTLPLRIVTDPPGATLSVDGTELEARTPLVIRMGVRDKRELTLRRSGYESIRLTVDAADELVDPMLVLRRKPRASSGLVARPIGKPTLVGDALYVPLAGGRVQTLRTTDGERLALYEAPDLGELYSAPLFTRGSLFFGDSNGRCVSLHPNGRTERWVAKVDGSVRTTPAELEHGVLFATLEGRVHLLDAADGQELLRRDLGAAIETAPCVLEGAIAVGLEQDQRGYLVVLEGPELREVRRLELPAPPIGFEALGAQRILVTTDLGGLLVLDLQLEKPLIWSLNGNGPTEARPRIHGETVWFAPDRELLAIELGTGTILRTQALPEPMTGAPACFGEDWIYYSTEKQLVALRAETLAEGWRWGDEQSFGFVELIGSTLWVGEWSAARESSLRRFETADEWTR